MTLPCIALFLFLATLPESVPPPDLPAQGQQAFDKQDYSQAEQIFGKLVAQDPHDYYSRFYLGLTQTALHKDAEAIEQFRETLKLKPGLYEAELNLGMLYLRNQRPSEAITPLENALKSKPDNVDLMLYLAEAYRSASRWQEAASQYSAVLARQPKNAKAELGAAEALLHDGKLEEAAPHYQRAAALDSSLKSYLLELAVAFADAHREADAIPLLRQFPDDPGAREKLGQIYLAQNQPALAVPEFEAAVKLSSTSGNRLALATAYLRNNQENLAAPILKQELAASPNDFELQMTVGRIYRDQKNYIEAGNYFLRATKLKRDSPEAWSELAGVCVLAQLYPQALDALEQLHQLNAEKPGHFYLRAIVLDKMRSQKPAIANYQRFLELSGGKYPDEEFKARQRVRILEHEVNGR